MHRPLSIVLSSYHPSSLLPFMPQFLGEAGASTSFPPQLYNWIFSLPVLPEPLSKFTRNHLWFNDLFFVPVSLTVLLPISLGSSLALLPPLRKVFLLAVPSSYSSPYIRASLLLL